MTASLPATAEPLDDARAAGDVGETARGYIAPVRTPTPAITRLVNEINLGRRARYQGVAERTGATLEQVERRAAQYIYDKVPDGTYVQDNDGRWVRK